MVASAQGKGVPAHGVDAVCRFAFGQVGFARLELRIEPANVASTRTAERCGFEREGLLRSHEVIAGTRRDLATYARLGPTA